MPIETLMIGAGALGLAVIAMRAITLVTVAQGTTAIVGHLRKRVRGPAHPANLI